MAITNEQIQAVADIAKEAEFIRSLGDNSVHTIQANRNFLLADAILSIFSELSSLKSKAKSPPVISAPDTPFRPKRIRDRSNKVV